MLARCRDRRCRHWRVAMRTRPWRERANDRRFLRDNDGFVSTPVFDGVRLLAGNTICGPAIIEEETTTIVVFPGWRVRLDNPGMYVMTTGASA